VSDKPIRMSEISPAWQKAFASKLNATDYGFPKLRDLIMAVKALEMFKRDNGDDEFVRLAGVLKNPHAQGTLPHPFLLSSCTWLSA
jgi:hypothetical protein